MSVSTAVEIASRSRSEQQVAARREQESERSRQRAEEQEQNRWLLLLAPSLIVAAACFGGALAGPAWLMAGALVAGPMFLIFALIYLSLSTDTNRDG